MLMFTWMLAILNILHGIQSKPLTNGIRPTNILGGQEQHASFSFVRPGLTQTAFAFNGPSSHQSFSSSVGDPHLAHKVLPSVAHTLTYRNPGLSYTVDTSTPSIYQSQPLDYHQQQDLAIAYQQQLQQYLQYQQQQQPVYSEYVQMQEQPTDADIQQKIHQQYDRQVLVPRFAIPHAKLNNEGDQKRTLLQEKQQVPQRSQQYRTNLLGIAYSSAPSVAHVKVNGNGYKFDF